MPHPMGALSTALALALLLGIVLATDAWVYADAKKQAGQGNRVLFSMGSFQLDTPAAWFIACLAFWELFFPLYIDSRRPA